MFFADFYINALPGIHFLPRAKNNLHFSGNENHSGDAKMWAHFLTAHAKGIISCSVSFPPYH